MAEGSIRYYILFANYEQGLKLHNLLTEDGVKNRIAPAPRAIQGELSCGMSLLIEPADLEAAKACIEKTQGEYHSIVLLEGQIKSRRDHYC